VFSPNHPKEKEPAMKELTITLHPDRWDLSLQTDEGDEGITVEVLEQAIRVLQTQRAQTAPEVPTSVPLGRQIEIVSRPSWWTEPAFEGGSVILHRHPGLGWSGFSLSPEDAQNLIRLLQEQLSSQEPTTSSQGNIQ